jgi:small subunit ribosomal protein S17
MTEVGEKKGVQRGRRKVRVGIVVSDKMQKSVVVECQRRFLHPVYGKAITRTLRVMAHNEDNSAKVGDKVEIMETRPFSKRKRWRVVRILEKAK